MDVYNYLAISNPQKTKDIINSFGYKITDPESMGGNLRTLVAKEGESALKKVIENHPDKEIILELFGEPETVSCKTCEERERFEKYLNASGSSPSEAKKTEQNFSILFLSGIMILTVAILSTKK